MNKLTKYQKALDNNYLITRIQQRLNGRIKPEQLLIMYETLFRKDEVSERYRLACLCKTCNKSKCECKNETKTQCPVCHRTLGSQPSTCLECEKYHKKKICKACNLPIGSNVHNCVYCREHEKFIEKIINKTICFLCNKELGTNLDCVNCRNEIKLVRESKL